MFYALPRLYGFPSMKLRSSTRLEKHLLTLIAMLIGTCGATDAWAAPAATTPPKTDGVATRAAVDRAIEKVYPALVRIYVVVEKAGGGRMKRMRASGSGAIVSSDGYVVTNHHVAGNATRITCNLSDGDMAEAICIGTDPMADISVLKLKLDTRKYPDRPLAVAKWGDSSKLKVGDIVLAMGCPAAVSQSVTQGIVSNTQMLMPNSGNFRLDGENVGRIVRWIGHDAVIFHGNSGGPLVNLQGEIIGINEIGLGSLGGAIPSNLARRIVSELIEHGEIKRSWTGLEFQHRLKSDKHTTGALVGGVVQDSPAAKAGLKAGDIVTRFHGQEVDAELPEHLPLLNQLMVATPVGETVEVAYLRDGKQHVVELKTEHLQRALGKPQELKEWGITARNITRMMALERHREDTKGAMVHSLRSGAGAVTAKLPLRSGDVIRKVKGEEIADVAALKRITARLTEGKTKLVPVLVAFDRGTKQLLTIIKIGREKNKNRPASANKPWSSMDTQVLTSDLAKSLKMPGQPGVRVVEVFKRQAAEKAGVNVGDIILAINNRRVRASHPGDRNLFNSMIRRMSVGGEAVLKIVRDGEPMEITMTLEAPPVNDENIKKWNDTDFEFAVRELSYNDRVDKQIPEDLPGVFVQKVENGGLASLGGLRLGDFLMSIDGESTATVDELKAILEDIRVNKPRRVVFFVRRGIHTLFCEIELDYQ